MSTYTIVKNYRVYRGRTGSGEPLDEFGGVELRGWLKDRGYTYEKAEQMIKQLHDRGSITVQTGEKDADQ